ncbi:EVE domain-containing protein [Pseudochrobactrum asaccharolyticum]|uniref:EVE domain-containing protein n=1 Tax=Pseudochrobactrum asaccharolyticum TaxID=354351 RepID=UPI001F1C696A|nr:EVE domain-containing protein [Pseudochrobactrum asaccharolyticum]MCF7645186.1 EVE domain-containing protein [Pseudochrobactrum asaccharolyticum]
MSERGRKYWLAIASADHVQRGRAEGFMQVCHGKSAPLRRLKSGDGVIYYSPAMIMGGKDRLQSFTAQGVISNHAVYQVDMGQGFLPYRRDVQWNDTMIISICPLLDRLELTRGKTNWAYPFRFGLLELSEHDFKLIAEAMAVT